MTAHPADEFLRLFLARDWDRLRTLFAADSVWTMPGDGAITRIDTYLSDVGGKNAFFVEPGGAS